MSRYSQRSIQDDSRIVMDISAENGVAIRSSVHMDRFCFFKKGALIYIYICMYVYNINIYIYTCVCVFRLCSCLLGASSPETLLTALERERETFSAWHDLRCISPYVPFPHGKKLDCFDFKSSFRWLSLRNLVCCSRNPMRRKFRDSVALGCVR